MFTGIVDRAAKVESCTLPSADSTGPGSAGTLIVETGYSDLTLGESVAINGVCLTVVEYAPSGRAIFAVSRETFERSTLAALAKRENEPATVHVERALQAGARLSGHWVQGHADGVATLVRATPAEGCTELEFSITPELGKYCVQKGSITLDGVSLTLNRVWDDVHLLQTRFTVMIIPHTWELTHFHALKPGDRVTVEVDVLAKLIERMHVHRQNFSATVGETLHHA